jgi:hypothetical protein
MQQQKYIRFETSRVFEGPAQADQLRYWPSGPGLPVSRVRTSLLFPEASRR